MFFTSAEEIKLLTNLFFCSQFSTSAKLPSLRIYSTCLKAETLVPSGFLSDLILKWNITINFFHCHHKFIACLNAHIRPYSVRIGFIGKYPYRNFFSVSIGAFLRCSLMHFTAWNAKNPALWREETAEKICQSLSLLEPAVGSRKGEIFLWQCIISVSSPTRNPTERKFLPSNTSNI